MKQYLNTRWMICVLYHYHYAHVWIKKKNISFLWKQKEKNSKTKNSIQMHWLNTKNENLLRIFQQLFNHHKCGWNLHWESWVALRCIDEVISIHAFVGRDNLDLDAGADADVLLFFVVSVTFLYFQFCICHCSIVSNMRYSCSVRKWEKKKLKKLNCSSNIKLRTNALF